MFGKKALEIIRMLLPYLIVKLPQANVVLAYEMRPKEKLTGKLFRLTQSERTEREMVVQVIRKLNERGFNP